MKSSVPTLRQHVLPGVDLMQLMSAALLVSVGETHVQGHQQMRAVLQMRLQAADVEQLLCET